MDSVGVTEGNLLLCVCVCVCVFAKAWLTLVP